MIWSFGYVARGVAMLAGAKRFNAKGAEDTKDAKERKVTQATNTGARRRDGGATHNQITK